MGEKFELKNYQSRTDIFVEEELVFSDYTFIRPDEMDYTKIGMWGEYTHCGMLFLYMENMEDKVEICRKIQQQSENRGLLSGATRCPKGVLIRSLGKGGDQIYKFHFEIVKQLNS